MPKYGLTYFDGRGRGELIRIMFHLAKRDFEDRRISMENWAGVKPSTPFGQLPVFKIDDKEFTQSVAIAKYVAAEFGYYPDNNLDKLKVDEVCCLIGDHFAEVVKAFTEKDEAKKAELLKNFIEVVTPKYLAFYEGLLKKSGTGYFVGKKVTLADLMFYDFIFGVKIKSPPGLLDKYPLAAALFSKVENIPELKAYVATRKETAF